MTTLTTSKPAMLGAGAVRLPFRATPKVSRSSRQQLHVCAAKGKQRMRQGGGSVQQQQSMSKPPTPPVDPENDEFVVFVRSTKLPQWVPLSVVKGGASANLLVKSMETEWGRKLYGRTLVENIGKAIYKDQDQIIRQIKASYPPFRDAVNFAFGFKIRDKSQPEKWWLADDVMVIPPESELQGTAIDRMKSFFAEATAN